MQCVIEMKPLAFILLLLHINFSMFIPQIDEKDIYDSNCQQVQDINSLSEYIQTCYTNHPKPHHNKDSDDDNARYFHSLKPHFFLLQPFAVVKKENTNIPHGSIPLTDDASLSAGFSNIQSPPPKA